MAVNKTLTLSWKGVEYDVLVTMRLIDKIEEEINLMKMVARASENDVRYSHASKLISLLLQSVGCHATQDDIWEGLSDSDGDMDAVAILNTLWEIFAVIFPEPKKKDVSVKKKVKR